MRRLGTATIAGAAVAVVAAGVACSAPGPEVLAGIGGEWQVGAWTPLEVTWPDAASAGASTVRVSVEDFDGQFVSSPPVPVQPGDGGIARAVVPVRFGRPDGRVRVVAERGTILESRFGVASDVANRAIPSTSQVALVFGDLPQAVRAMRLVDRERHTTTAVVAATRGEAPVATGYDMADEILICGTIVPSLPATVIDGIDAWVRSGGRLVLLAGASAAGIAARDATAGWLPGRFERMTPLRRVAAVETFARATGLAELVPPDGIEIPRFSGAVRGASDASVVEGSLTLPLATRRAHGFGTLTWAGVDVDREPFRGWSGTEALLFAALEGRRTEAGDADGAGEGSVVDLAAQLGTALERFPARPAAARPQIVSFEVVAAVGVLYVLALYPFDWWLVSRVAARPRLAWLTLPGLAMLFTAAAAWLASGRLGTGKAQGTTAEVVDIDVESGAARGSAWAAVFSGGNERIDVAAGIASPIVAPRSQSVSWFADAGRGFGAMDAAVAHPSLAAANYGYGDSLAELLAVPVAAGATRLFEARWSGSVERGLVESTLRHTDQGTLAGGVVHRLPCALERCRLLHAGWLYDLGTLPANAEYECEAGRGPRSLAAALTRRRAGEDRELSTRWDVTSSDAARILELAGFYAAAGGRDYAGLPAGRLGRLDLSELLIVDRAVLIGEPEPAAHMTAWQIAFRGGGVVSHDPAAPTLFRLVLPVAPEAEP